MQKKITRKRRLAAFLLAAAVSITSIPLGGGTAEAAQAPEGCTLLARYPLQQDVKDISGNNYDGTAHGSVTYEDGLTLPGGKKTSDSGASYVSLPGEIFVGREKLTISTWIKNKTAKGNYAALFFGTPAQQNNMPLNYWLFNPVRDDHFKSVVTDDNKADKPYETEAGVNEGATGGYRDQWAYYTTIITEDSVTGYINGQKIGSAQKTKTIASFGDTLEAYIGRSNYLGDTTYAGSFQDLTVYEGAMTDAQVQQMYLDAEQVNDNIKSAVLQEIKRRLSLSDQIQGGSLTQEKPLALPREFMGAAVTWSSSNPAVISADGRVKLPADYETVILTATIRLGSLTAEKAFPVTVMREGGALAYQADSVQIPYVLSAKTVLPTKIGTIAITWSGSDKVKADGSLTADFDGILPVSLQADFSDGKNTATRQFSCCLLGKDAGYVQPYTRTPSGDCVDKLARSMFLAYSDNGTDGFTALHDDYGVLFMRAESDSQDKLTPKSLKDPYLFYTKEGGYGVAAVRTEVNGGTDATKASSVMFYTSDDLIEYDEVGFVDLHTDEAVCEPVCEYDAAADCYRITWNDGGGNYYQNTLKTLQSEASHPVPVSAVSIQSADTGLSGTKQGNLFAMEHTKALRLKNKMTKLVNNGMQVPKKVRAASAQEVQSVRATALYNDGSTASKSVDWDLSNVKFDTPGTYTVSGTVTQPTFDNSKKMFHARPDPEMVKYNGKFYFISTDENGQGRIYIRQSDTLAEIKNSSETLLMDGNTFSDLFKTCLWAPELHVIEGRLYIFFAGSLTKWDGVQSHVMRLREGGDPMKIADWEKPIRVKDKEGNNLYDTDTQGITLDMTYFENNGVSYVAWAQRQLKPVDTGSWLYIATVDKEKPWQLTSDRVAICKPDYGWDNNNTFVVEAPFALQTNGKIYLTFSGGATDHTYCIGVMTAASGSNLLDASSWRKSNSPILSSWSVPNQYGPGHNAYIKDDDGVVYNIYHAKWGRSDTRSASIRRVHFDADGDPVLDLVEERDLLDEFKPVTMQVEVVGDSYQPKEELRSLVDTCGQAAEKGQGLTARADWEEFNESLAAAKNLLAQADAEQSSLIAATNRLEQAFGKLRSIQALALVQKPAKTEYQTGESFQAFGMKLEATDDKGARHEIAARDCEVTGFDSQTPGERQITVSYQGQTVSFAVTVRQTAVNIQKIEIAQKPSKTEYQTGEALDLTGLKVSAVDETGAKHDVDVKDCTVTGFDSSTPGEKQITVAYQGLTATFTVTVKAGTDTPVAPTAPTAVKIKKKASAYNAVTLQWNKAADADGYVVYRATSKQGSYKKIKTIAKAGTLTYKDGKLAFNKTYYYKVRAYKNADGKTLESKDSNVLGVKTQLEAPSVSLSKKSKTKLTVKWKKVAGASGYQVQYSLKKKSGFRTANIKKAKATSYTKSGLKKGKTYYMKVRAYRTVKGKKITGAFSKVKSIKMK